jgi:hypothetical protein
MPSVLQPKQQQEKRQSEQQQQQKQQQRNSSNSSSNNSCNSSDNACNSSCNNNCNSSSATVATTVATAVATVVAAMLHKVHVSFVLHACEIRHTQQIKGSNSTSIDGTSGTVLDPDKSTMSNHVHKVGNDAHVCFGLQAY